MNMRFIIRGDEYGARLRLLIAEKRVPHTYPQSCAGLKLDFLQRKGHRAFFLKEVGCAGKIKQA
jgi:hypothetical protein